MVVLGKHFADFACCGLVVEIQPLNLSFPTSTKLRAPDVYGEKAERRERTIAMYVITPSPLKNIVANIYIYRNI